MLESVFFSEKVPVLLQNEAKILLDDMKKWVSGKSQSVSKKSKKSYILISGVPGGKAVVLIRMRQKNASESKIICFSLPNIHNYS